MVVKVPRKWGYTVMELVLECPVEIAQEVGKLLKDKMEEAGNYFITSVPIEAAMIVADSWAEEH